MYRSISFFLYALAASPVVANYGDVDAQLREIRPSTVVIADPIVADDVDFAIVDICALPLGLMVSIPETFVQSEDLSLACLDK